MGVTGLWTVVAPTARPTSLASLNRKRLAVDASIWIYQFLKAVRDKEGNALRNSHVVGFFRRICKLLYFGIKPVFVFDGGAPVLKRETVVRRRRRREGRRDDAVRTAAKLVTLQMERAVEEEKKKQREKEHVRNDVEEELGDESELVYVDEIGMGKAERQKERREGFRKKDQYHLPDLDVSIESMRGVDDLRIMSQQELEEYARQFHSGEDINLYDFSKIDFESPFFLSLPAGDRYNILNAARLRSRLRMGYSKEQLDGMFPDRMAFSRFQIERVKERNELTQRLMHINGMSEFDINQGGRIAGEKGKEYVLVRNEGVEGGWALGVVSNKQGSKREDAIDLEAEEEDFDQVKTEDDEDEFEDVAIEGLNRLPKAWKRKRKEVDYDMSYEDAAATIAKKRRAVYDGRRAEAEQEARRPKHPVSTTTTKPEPAKGSALPEELNNDGLFVAQDTNGVNHDEDDDLFEDVDIEPRLLEEDDELQRAIAMSLEKVDDANDGPDATDPTIEDDDDDMGFDMQAALAESRKSKHIPKTQVRDPSPKPAPSNSQFTGPLPFESLNLGQSLLGKKKAKKVEEDLSGGFDRNLGEDAFRKTKGPQPMPSWFEAAPSINDLRPSRIDEEGEDHVTYGGEDSNRREILRRHPTKEIIDLEAEASQKEPMELSSDDDDGADQRDRAAAREVHEWELPEEKEAHIDLKEEAKKRKEEEEREERYRLARDIAGEDDTTEANEITMGDIAEETRVELPSSPDVPSPILVSKPALSMEVDDAEEFDNEDVHWSDSEADEQDAKSLSPTPEAASPAPAFDNRQAPVDDEDEEFEDVEMQDALRPPAFLQQQSTSASAREANAEQYLLPDDEDDDRPASSMQANAPLTSYNDEDYLSGSDAAEEEELMRQLAIEAEEHARFANSLNATKTPLEAARDYEAELKNLRSQQKKDRRDADEVTQTMIQECQALLSLFGLPYITAPMEAEAQCAELVHLGLVDGIVTDDSDIFLFGGTRVYKNMFNAAKLVECYLASDLEKEYALDRRKLIRFAHLLGSDYTEGIQGVGPVTALEIITDFATLEEFSEWCDRVQVARPVDLEGQLSTPFRRKFKSAVQKRVFLPKSFPDRRVDEAYLKPEVDSDPEAFVWGVPDLDKLRGFLMATIGWNQERTDEVLVPVVRDMNRRGVEGTQANITRFFQGGVGVGGGGGEGARNRTGKESGRMENAYRRLRGEAERKRRGVVGVDVDVGEEAEGGDRRESEEISEMGDSRKKKGGKRKKNVTAKRKKPVSDSNDSGTGTTEMDEFYEPNTKKTKSTGRRGRQQRKVDDDDTDGLQVTNSA